MHPNNAEWSTIVHADEGSLNLRTDNYVHVRGEVLGEMEGENAFGGTVSAVEVDADQVERVEGVDAIDPTQETVQVGQTQTLPEEDEQILYRPRGEPLPTLPHADAGPSPG